MRFPRFLITFLALVMFTTGVADESSELVDLVIGFLQDPDNDTRALAFEQIRSETKGEAATKKFAQQLATLPAEAKVGLLSALSDRADKAARPEVLEVLASKDTTVRLAAIRALGDLGLASDLKTLVGILDQGSSAEQPVAKASLVRLQDSGVSTSLAKMLQTSSSSLKIKLLDVLTVRRALDTIPTMLSTSLDKDEKVRRAAMTSLGKIADTDSIPGMVKSVLAAKNGSELAAGEKNIMFVCNRVADKEKRADALIAAINKLGKKDRMTMLSTLGRVGGSKAEKMVVNAVDQRDAAMHSAGLRALTNWPDASVAPKLIDLAQKDRHKDHRIAALRALIRISPLPDGRTDQQKLDLLKKAMSMSSRDSERLFALRRASAIRIIESLRFVVPYLDKKAFSQQACESIVELAHHIGLREPNEAEFHKALDRVIQLSKDPVVVDRAQRYKKDQTWVRPK